MRLYIRSESTLKPLFVINGVSSKSHQFTMLFSNITIICYQTYDDILLEKEDSKIVNT